MIVRKAFIILGEIGVGAVVVAMGKGRGAFGLCFQTCQAFGPHETLQNGATIVVELRPNGGKTGVERRGIGPIDRVTREVDNAPCIRRSGHGVESPLKF